MSKKQRWKMSLEQRIIQNQIDKREMIIQCCVTYKIKVFNGYYVGFYFKKPYNNISYGFSPEGIQYLRAYMKMLREEKQNAIHKKTDA